MHAVLPDIFLFCFNDNGVSVKIEPRWSMQTIIGKIAFKPMYQTVGSGVILK